MKNMYFRKVEREIYLQEITSVRTKTLQIRRREQNLFAVGQFCLPQGIKVGLRPNNGGNDQSNLPICPQLQSLHIQKAKSSPYSCKALAYSLV